MSAPRILHCLRSPVGGLFRHVRDLAGEQARRGYAVGIICDNQAADSLTAGRLAELDATVSLGVHGTTMPRGLGLSDFTAYGAVRDIIQALQIDIAHGHGAKGGAYARLAGRALKARGQSVTTIYTPHGGSLHYQPGTPAAQVFLQLERTLMQATDGIIFESAFAQKRYRDHVGGSHLHQRVVFNGLQPDEFVSPITRNDATDLLFIGELRHLKGIDVLLQALARVHRTRDVTLTIVGEGADRETLTALRAELGLGDAVRFVGAKPAREAFTLGRCLVVPSRQESLPYVVLEAGAAGMPLIATDVGGIAEIVQGSDTDLIASDDVAGLADAILDVLADPEAAVARAAQLRQVISSRFTVDAMTDGICAFYADCAVALAA
ncbi:MAG: glycosyltransferase family 4 protein [Hyphomicrobiaceae bacterium]